MSVETYECSTSNQVLRIDVYPNGDRVIIITDAQERGNRTTIFLIKSENVKHIRPAFR
jgi:hypothetical protein